MSGQREGGPPRPVSSQISAGQTSPSQTSRLEIRRLIAALADAGWSSARLDALSAWAATAGATIEPALNDPDRLSSVRATGLGVGPNPELDRVAMLTALALGTPAAVVTLIDADCQMVAGRHTGDTELERLMPLSQSLCKFAVASGEPFIVEDARRYPLSAANPLVQSGVIAAYAGVPLVDADDRAVGALASWDVRPRRWTNGHIQILNDLARVVASKVFGRQR